jgi:transposase
MPKHDEARRIAVDMLGAGLAMLPEVAQALGVSRHLVRYWCERAGVDWKRIRAARVATLVRRRSHKRPSSRI